MGMMGVSEHRFYEIQKSYLFPVIDYVYEVQKKSIVVKLQNETLTVAGDGRFDSPGYSVKYGTYNNGH